MKLCRKEYTHIKSAPRRIGVYPLVALCWIIAAWPAGAQGAEQDIWLPFAPGNQIRLGFERRGSRVAVATVAPKSYIEASRDRFVVTRRGATTVLSDLNLLRTHVRITSRSSVLRYVRLRTTPRTFYFWPFAEQETEVLARREARNLPVYGVDSWRYFRPDADSGWLGVLSPSAYRDGGFGPPRIKCVPGGFTVTRWILRRDVGVSLMREFVGLDGAYKQTVLRPWRVRPLRGTTWGLPDDEE